jgi:hypothetical protein
MGVSLRVPKAEAVPNHSGLVTCFCCDKKDSVLLRLDWILICRQCLQEYIDKINELKDGS